MIKKSKKRRERRQQRRETRKARKNTGNTSDQRKKKKRREGTDRSIESGVGYWRRKNGKESEEREMGDIIYLEEENCSEVSASSVQYSLAFSTFSRPGKIKLSRLVGKDRFNLICWVRVTSTNLHLAYSNMGKKINGHIFRRRKIRPFWKVDVSFAECDPPSCPSIISYLIDIIGTHDQRELLNK